MRAKKIVISAELYQKLVESFASSLGIRQSLVNKSLESFLVDLLEHLTANPEKLKELLSAQNSSQATNSQETNRQAEDFSTARNESSEPTNKNQSLLSASVNK